MKYLTKKTGLFSLSMSLMLLATLNSGCTTERSPFDKGYDLGSSDTAKRQYWAEENLQKEKHGINQHAFTYRTVSIPVYGKNQDGSNIAPHYVSVRIIND